MVASQVAPRERGALRVLLRAVLDAGVTSVVWGSAIAQFLVEVWARQHGWAAEPSLGAARLEENAAGASGSARALVLDEHAFERMATQVECSLDPAAFDRLAAAVEESLGGVAGAATPLGFGTPRPSPVSGASAFSHDLSAALFAQLAAQVQRQLGVGVGARPRRDAGRLHAVCFGVSGSGVSSALNTLAGWAVCPESGGQLAGTRGAELRLALSFEGDAGVAAQPERDSPAPAPAPLALALLDTAGLRSDRRMSAGELAALLGAAGAEASGMPDGELSAVLVTLNVEARAEPAALFNTLALLESLAPVRERCWLVLTHWGSNSVMAQWNGELLTYARAARRSLTLPAAAARRDPPTPEVMLRDLRAYLDGPLAAQGGGAAGCKRALDRILGSVAPQRVLWGCSLDASQREDRAEGALPAHLERLYVESRRRCVDALTSQDMLPMHQLPFVGHSAAQLEQLARDAIARAEA
jgi:hypothetical protein